MIRPSLSKLTAASLYLLMIPLGILFWLFIPEVADFVGASSLIYALLLSLGLQRRWLSFVVLTWIPLYTLGMISFYVVAQKRKKYLPLSIFASGDLIVSLVFIAYKILSSNYLDLGIMITGWFVRTFQYVGLVYYLCYSNES